MSDLRIADAPELEESEVQGGLKIPTGGFGNKAINMNTVASWVVKDKDLPNKGYVDNATTQVNQGLSGHVANKNNPHEVTKAQLGLGNVDNTADTDKPVSNAVNAALNTKADKSLLDGKADKSATYTKEEVDGTIDDLYQSLEDNFVENGAALPYDPQVTYNDGAIVVEGGVLKKVKGGVLVNAVDAESINVGDTTLDVFAQKQKEKVITARDGGAKGDGVTLDTQALRAQIANLKSGQKLILQDGTYLIDGSLGNLPRGASIVCDGNAEIKLSATAIVQPWVKIITATEDNLIQVNIDGGRYNTIGITGIGSKDTVGWKNVKILNCNIKNTQNAMFAIGASRCLIMGNTVTGTRNSGLLFSLIAGEKVMRNTIANNNFEDMGDTAVAFHSSHLDVEMAYNIVHGNTAKDTQRITGGFAFDFEEGVGELKHHNIFSNNVVEQEFVSEFSQCGFVMGDCRDSLITGNIAKGNRNLLSIGIDIFEGHRITVSNNKLDNFRTGIHTRLTKDCQITGNTILDCGSSINNEFWAYSGITLTNGGDVKNLKVKDNTIIFSENFTDRCAGIGAYCGTTRSMQNIDIKDNTIIGCIGYSIGLQLNSELNKNINIDGNNIYCSDGVLSPPIRVYNTSELALSRNLIINPKHPVTIQKSDKVTISSNKVRDERDVSELSSYFSIGSNQAQQSTNVRLFDNDLESLAANPLLVPVADLTTITLRDNLGFKTRNIGSTTATAGSVVTHGLAFRPKNIVVTPRAAATGLFVSDITTTTFKINFNETNQLQFDWVAEY